MADSNALARAKKQAMLDAVLTTNIEDQEAPALALLNKLMNNADYEMYNGGSNSISISKFEQGYNELYTRCYTDISGIQNIQENSEIQIVTSAPDTTYNGYYRAVNIDYTNYSFEIRKVFSVTKTAAGTLTRKTDLENAHAYLILHLLISAGQELVQKKVLFSSQSFGEGTITQAGQESKISLAADYRKKAISYLNYCYSEAI